MKDNLNGLATIKDVQKGINFDCGVISISNPNDSNVRLIEKYGNTEHIEEIFEKHRLEKVEEKLNRYIQIILVKKYLYLDKIFIFLNV